MHLHCTFTVTIIFPSVATVRHGISDPVQYQLHLVTHPPLQSDGAAHQHGHPQTGPLSIQVRISWLHQQPPLLPTPVIRMSGNNYNLTLTIRRIIKEVCGEFSWF